MLSIVLMALFLDFFFQSDWNVTGKNHPRMMMMMMMTMAVLGELGLTV